MQTFLDIHKRPVVSFDVNNPAHREQVTIFLRNGTWGKSPYMFYVPGDISVKAYVIDAMIDYYCNNEFPVKAEKLIRRKKTANLNGTSKKGGKLISIGQTVK